VPLIAVKCPLLGCRPCAHAQVQAAQSPTFTKPIRLVVPFPAGGGVDVIARALAEGLARELGQPVVIDNKAGAGTAIGNDAVAKAPPDGMTILLNTNAIAIIPSLNPKLPYVTDTPLRPSRFVGRAPIVAVVRAESPLRTGVDFVARARAKPGA
jgi:tripartite-type tricarboxylate transporter receptor subunit TctC